MDRVLAGDLPIGDEYPPRIMGVLNVSLESPYDPSVFADPEAAARYVDRSLIAEGADIVDIGLASANRRLDVLEPDAELERLKVALEVIDRVAGEAVFSIETRYASVADAALSAGFEMVNDVCGFADPEMAGVCRDHDAAVVKMASPPDLERPGAVEEIDWERRRGAEWARNASHVDMVDAALGADPMTEQTILDPAFGRWSEAQDLAGDRALFRSLERFRAHGRPLLVSINRKNFLGEIVDRPTEKRLSASLAATALAIDRGVHVVRTHDVEATLDAVRVADRLRGDDGPELESSPGASIARESVD